MKNYTTHTHVCCIKQADFEVELRKVHRELINLVETRRVHCTRSTVLGHETRRI